MGLSTETVDRLAEKLLAPQGGDNMPVILCRRHVPHERTYLLFDAGWEGLKKAGRGGRVSWEIDLDFQLRIEIDGLCAIPDTKNNRAKLEIVSKPIESWLDHDPITGIKYAEPKRHISLPEYTKVEQTILEKGLVDAIYQQVMEKMANQAGPQPEPVYANRPDNRPGRVRLTETLPVDDGTDLGEGEAFEVPAAARRQRPAKATKKETKPKGRPKGRDPLLEPIGG